MTFINAPKVLFAVGILPLFFFFGGVLVGRSGRTVQVSKEERTTTTQQQVEKAAVTIEHLQDTVVKAGDVETVHDIRRPDGTVEETKTVRHTAEREVKQNEVHQQVQERVVVETKEVVKVEERRVEVARCVRPDWIVGVQGGVSVPDLPGRSGGTNYIPGLPDQAVVGGFVMRRILGPLYGGAWANSRGAAGLQVGAAW